MNPTFHFSPESAKSRGFTLIEVMITIAIIGLLTAIAMPGYKDYVIRGKIPDATSYLATKRAEMEQHFLDNKTYENFSLCTTADTTSSKNFNFSCSVAGTTAVYTLQAQGKNAMAGFTYTINQANDKRTTIGTPAPTKWHATAVTCWVTKTGGVC
jgi:type IV pilus assembly protein PilE